MHLLITYLYDYYYIQSYSYLPTYLPTYLPNSSNSDVVTATQPGAILMGGGEDVEEAFIWAIKNANGGDFVVLRTSG